MGSTPSRRLASRAVAHPGRLLAALLTGLVLLGLGHSLRPDPPARDLVGQSARNSAPPSATPAPRRVPKGAGASGLFAYAVGSGPTLGSAGPTRRYRVAVELPAAPAVIAEFAREVDRVLGDERSWIAAERYRLRRVPYEAYAEFTVFLASPRTSQRMCRTGGLETEGFTSCRLDRQVIINDRRWQSAVPGYGASLATYRAYAINHEVGHQLGHGHETCPGRGRRAPVMMQQTYGLKGCRANAWPYLDGRRYAGPRVR